MKANYVHKDTLTATDYVNLQKDNELIVSYNQQLLKENNELKKQLEEYKKDIKDLDNQNKRSFENMQLNQLEVCNMIKQQKEFIKWLEDYLNLFDNMDIDEQISYDMIEEILQKYKEIIGVSDENN